MGSEEKRQKSLPRILASEAKTFMCHTTLHGAQHVGDDQRHKVVRVLWLLTLLSMAGSLLFTLSKLYGRYMTYPHTTTLIVSHSEDQPLPAVTVCLRDPVDLERLRLAFPQSHAMVEKFLTDKSALNWSDPLVAEAMGNVTLQQVMNQSSFRVEEIVVKATKAHAEIDNISQVFATRDFLNVINPVRCYTYNSGERSQEGITLSLLDELILYLRQTQTNLLPFDDIDGLYMLVHERNGFPISGMYTTLAFGTNVDVTLTPRKFRYLPAPYNSLGGKDCLETDAPDFRSPIRHFKSYSVMNCMWERMIYATDIQCGCTTIGSFGNDDLPHCSLLQMHTCYNHALIAQATVNYRDGGSNCTAECTFTLMQFKYLSVPFPSDRYMDYRRQQGKSVDNFTKEDSIKLKIRFESSMTYLTQHEPALTLDDIYSEVGGQMGLFLGASVLTVTELLEHLCHLIWASVRHLCRRRTPTISQR